MISARWLGLALVLAACRLPGESPPPAPPQPQPSASEPAPLPPEETPSPEAPPPADPPNAKPVEPGITTTGAPTRGTLPKAVIDEKLKAAGPAIHDCYERGLKTKPTLRGTLGIRFVVGTDGKVAHADADASDESFDDDATVACILSEIRKLEFPQPRGGRVFIDYPLRLEPPAPSAP
jgi:hypothetical protein